MDQRIKQKESLKRDAVKLTEDDLFLVQEDAELIQAVNTFNLNKKLFEKDKLVKDNKQE